MVVSHQALWLLFVYFGLCISALLLAGISLAEGIFVAVATVGPYTMLEELNHQFFLRENSVSAKN